MHDNYNYPIGADNSDAPWNQVEPEPKEIEVTVSVTLSKTIKVKVDDYFEDPDEEGNIQYDFTECDLHSAVKEQYILPQDAYKYINGNTNKGKRAIKYLKDWDVDDIAINLE